MSEHRVPETREAWVRDMSRSGHPITEVGKPPKIARTVGIASLRRLGVWAIPFHAIEGYVEPSGDELQVTRTHLAGFDVALTAGTGDDAEIVAWGAAVPPGSYEKHQKESHR
jgi:hypothetical protein